MTQNKQYDAFWHNIHNIKTNVWESDEVLIPIYLEQYFKKNKKIQPFDEYFSNQYLENLLN